MEEIDVFKSLRESVDGELAPIVDEREAARLKLIADHKAWLKKIKKEHAFKSECFTAKNIRTDRQTEVLPVGKKHYAVIVAFLALR